MNRTRKGDYYRNRTRDWLEQEGWTVAKLEHRQRLFTKTGVIFRASDIWGSDLVAINGEDIVFVQVKSNEKHLAQGEKELKKWPFPKSVKLWVVRWPPSRRLSVGPDIVEVQ